MQYRRLTKRDNDGNLWTKCKDCAIYDKCDFSYDTCCEELTDRLAELEDKLKNGTLVELPCKVGDRIWVIIGKRVFGRKVKRIEISQAYYSIVTSDKTGWEELEIYYQMGFGKTWFLTKAEAEAKLEELKRGQE